jgi:integrase
MATARMTKADVDGLAAPDPSGKQQIYWAEQPKNGPPKHQGLGVLVSGTTGAKSWVAQAKLPNGTARRVTIGPVHVFSIEKAWDAAKTKLADIYNGVDPREEKRRLQREARSNETTSKVLEEFLTAHPRLSQQTHRLYRWAVERLGPLADVKMRTITAKQAKDQFEQVSAEIRAKRAAGETKGGVNVTGRTSANIALGVLGSLWNWQGTQVELDGGEPWPRNPTLALKELWHPTERRKRLVEFDRLPEFYAAAKKLGGIRSDLVVLGIFTGMRASNIEGLRWDEVHLSEKMIRVPGKRMKNGRDFNLPMNDIVRDLLVARRTMGRGDFVFPGNGRERHTRSFNHALKKIAADTGIVVSPHDLRRGYASIANATPNLPYLAIKMLLAHSTSGDVTSSYIGISQTQLAGYAQLVADEIKRHCGIEQVEGVVKMG